MPDALTPQVFAILSALVEERVGLSFRSDDAAIFGDKVQGRMREAGFTSPLDYYYALRYDDPHGKQLDALVDALVVGETYFFREVEPLATAITLVVRHAVETRGVARIWSAACSTGEEPLSIAMLLEESGLAGATEVVATDVSGRSLSRARAGVYGARSMRVLTGATATSFPLERLRAMTDRHVRERDGAYHVDPALLERVTFQKLNLLDEDAVRGLGTFDLIVCRNVLIYFCDEVVRRVVTAIAGGLRDDGRLLVGASESLMRFGTLLECEERAGSFFYTRGRA